MIGSHSLSESSIGTIWGEPLFMYVCGRTVGHESMTAFFGR